MKGSSAFSAHGRGGRIMGDAPFAIAGNPASFTARTAAARAAVLTKLRRSFVGSVIEPPRGSGTGMRQILATFFRSRRNLHRVDVCQDCRRNFMTRRAAVASLALAAVLLA